MLVILDYGIGNINSIQNMIKKIGEEVVISSDKEIITKADRMILPGVGSFDSGMQKLRNSGLIESVKKHAIENRKPLLGICLGMQMLGRKSEEGSEAGLSLISFECKRFDFNSENNLKIPHMGWDIVTTMYGMDPLLQNLEPLQRYYFVHSYHAVCDNEENVLMKCDYGYPFAAAVKDKNIYGLQFHPEKSHNFGMAVLKNFIERC